MTTSTRRLRRSDVVDTALQILARVGLPDLTMRALGTELGVQQSALYHHVENKQALLGAVADEILARGPRRRGRKDDSWQDRVRRRCEDLHAAVTAYPDGADVVMSMWAFGMGGEAAFAELRELLTEIASMHELVSLRDATPADGIERAPGFTVQRQGHPEVAVTFAGLPLGKEFTSLVLALLQVGGHPVKEDGATLAAAKAVTGEHHFVTYMSLTCQNCPTVVQALDALAVLNPGVTHTVVEGSLFQDEIDREGVMAVPTVTRNGETFASGRMELSEILAKLDEVTGGSSAGAAAAALSEREPYEVLVLGGGPAGASAAIYAARKGIRTGLVAERFGGQVNDTMSIENLIGTSKTDGPTFAADLERHVHDYEIDLIKGQAASGITEAGADGLITIDLASGATLRSKSVILATGARWRTMSVPGEDEYRNKGVTFCPHCDGPLFKGKRVAVIGGGNSGVEAAIDLAGVVGHVTVVEFLDEMRADEVLQRKLKSLPNVDIVMSAVHRLTFQVGVQRAVAHGVVLQCGKSVCTECTR